MCLFAFYSLLVGFVVVLCSGPPLTGKNRAMPMMCQTLSLANENERLAVPNGYEMTCFDSVCE